MQIQIENSKIIKKCQIEKIIDEYYTERPVVFLPHNVNYNLDIPDIKQKIKWYFNTYP